MLHCMQLMTIYQCVKHRWYFYSFLMFLCFVVVLPFLASFLESSKCFLKKNACLRREYIFCVYLMQSSDEEIRLDRMKAKDSRKSIKFILLPRSRCWYKTLVALRRQRPMLLEWIFCIESLISMRIIWVSKHFFFLFVVRGRLMCLMWIKRT